MLNLQNINIELSQN